MSASLSLNNRNGFTLPELIVVMGIFMTVIIITATAFKTILSQSGKQLKSAETQIEGIVGLDLFRSDLQHAGYGLPKGFFDSRWLFQSGGVNPVISYDECAAGAVHGADPTALNDAKTGVPRGIASLNDAGLNGSDHLAVKSMVSGVNDTAKKWTYLSYSSGSGVVKRWNSAVDLVEKDRVVVIRSSFKDGINYKQLVVNGSTFFTSFPPVGSLFLDKFSPPNSTDTFLVYGVDPDTDLRMPFNRADYFIKITTGQVPATCAPHTGVLYKATVNQSGGGYTYIPLLDCVANLQIVYSLDTDGNGLIDQHYDASFGTPSAPGAWTAPQMLDLLWNQLREIRVYVLAQDGRRDPGYSYPTQVVTVGEFGMGRDVDLKAIIGAEWMRYHWKIYTIVVQPKSLNGL